MMIHDADLKDDRYDAPEAAGLGVVLRGLSTVEDDDVVLRLTARYSMGCTSTSDAA